MGKSQYKPENRGTKIEQETNNPIYFNAMGAQGTPYDLTLRLAYQVGDQPAEYEMKVVTSWAHAKAMVRALDRIVQQYEKDFGELPTTEQVQAIAEGGP